MNWVVLVWNSTGRIYSIRFSTERAALEAANTIEKAGIFGTRVIHDQSKPMEEISVKL